MTIFENGLYYAASSTGNGISPTDTPTLIPETTPTWVVWIDQTSLDLKQLRSVGRRVGWIRLEKDRSLVDEETLHPSRTGRTEPSPGTQPPN